MNRRGKEIVVQPLVPPDQIARFALQVMKIGVTSFFYEKPAAFGGLRKDVKIFSPSIEGDIILVSSTEHLKTTNTLEKPKAFCLTISKKEDLMTASWAVRQGIQYLVVDADDWKIIPLENLIAELHDSGVKIYARVDAPDEVETMFGVLEIGVDGIVLAAKGVDEVKRTITFANAITEVDLCLAKVVEVKDVGMGERVCIDTASILDMGEGILVGSRANFLFLVHNESVKSRFTEPRPFRVNAGSIHSYTLLPNGRTKYLSEMESGDKVLIVCQSGRARTAVIGRVKIERRPLRLIKAKHGSETGSILVQNAETIKLVGSTGMILPITEIKSGDKILTFVKPVMGRHFGAEVNEFLLEK